MTDSGDDADDTEAGTGRLPRETAVLFGHAQAEQALLDSYRSGHLPHAWLIGGPEGVGKATLAYRMARFVLANPDPSAVAVSRATSLAVPAEDRVARRIASESHSDLLVLERRLNDKGKRRQDIAVEDVRRSVTFFGSTAGEGGWRIAIVDLVEDLNRFGNNALLKILEEPPPRSLLLLVSAAPGRVLPTIRSRCRRILLRPLSDDAVRSAVATALGRDPNDEDIAAAAAAAEGSVSRALRMLDGEALALRERVLSLLAALPRLDLRAMHALGDMIGSTDQQKFAAFAEAINEWLANRLNAVRSDRLRALRIADAWDRVNTAARDAEIYNLDRKPLVFSTFGLLAEAAAD